MPQACSRMGSAGSSSTSSLAGGLRGRSLAAVWAWLALVPAGERQWTARSVSATVAFEYGRGPMPGRLILHQEAMYVQDVEAVRVP